MAKYVLVMGSSKVKCQTALISEEAFAEEEEHIEHFFTALDGFDKFERFADVEIDCSDDHILDSIYYSD